MVGQANAIEAIERTCGDRNKLLYLMTNTNFSARIPQLLRTCLDFHFVEEEPLATLAGAILIIHLPRV